MFDFHRTSPKMVSLRLCRIANESTETENCYKTLNRELRWLWNSVYVILCLFRGFSCNGIHKNVIDYVNVAQPSFIIK